MKKLSLRPYHGTIWLCDSIDELKRQYRRQIRRECECDIDPDGGYVTLVERGCLNSRIFLVYARNPVSLAHEMAHVLLMVFEAIGHDPRQGDGEPFCYMLSQLMLEAA